MPAGAVVVGVDGSAGANTAVEWAATEAGERGASLQLVFVHDPATEAGGAEARRRGMEFAQVALDSAARAAHTAHAGVDVVTAAVTGIPAATLVASTNRSAMICLGSNGTRPARPGHRVSTATEVLLGARCPVAVVRPYSPPHGWVVMPLEFEPSLHALLRLAFGEAELRGRPLHLLADAMATGAQNLCAADGLDRRLGQELVQLRLQHPHVHVAMSAPASVETFLLTNAGDIALFVAPQRRNHDIGTVLHPSAEAAVRLLRCPVLFGAP